MLLPACRADGASTSPPVDRTVLAQQTLDEAVAAARAGDEDRFRETLATRDLAFAARTAVWFANLSALPFQRVSLTLQPAVAEPPAARRKLLGSDAWVQQVEVSWQLLGTDRPAEQRVWLTFLADGDAVRLAADTDRPHGSAAGAVPVWLLERVTHEKAAAVSVLTADRSAADRWLARARTAVADVGRTASATTLVLVAPSSRQAFERVLGVAPGSYRDIAAVAWPMSDDLADAPVHVVVNPDRTARLGSVGIAVLLAHEVTHVATRSVDSPAPTWLVEGYADHVAYAAYPRAGAVVAKGLLGQIGESGLPRSLPSDSAFEPGAPDLDRAYGEAWLACVYIAERYGSARLDRFYAEVDDGRSPDQAARDALGVGFDDLVRGWLADLHRRSGS